MSFVAEFTIPPEPLPFGDTLVENSDMRIVVERIIPTAESAFPFFWVWGSSPEQFMDEAEREDDVAETRLLDTVEGGALFRAEWSPNAQLIQGLKELRATIIESEGTHERWRFEVRAEDRDRFNEFQRIFREQEIPISLIQLYDLADVVELGPQPLTPKQREVLLKAYEEGYFDDPREVTQEELGKQFDVSYRAVSDRLRRGTRNLIEATLLPTGERP